MCMRLVIYDLILRSQLLLAYVICKWLLSVVLGVIVLKRILWVFTLHRFYNFFGKHIEIIIGS